MFAIALKHRIPPALTYGSRWEPYYFFLKDWDTGVNCIANQTFKLEFVLWSSDSEILDFEVTVLFIRGGKRTGRCNAFEGGAMWGLRRAFQFGEEEATFAKLRDVANWIFLLQVHWMESTEWNNNFTASSQKQRSAQCHQWLWHWAPGLSQMWKTNVNQ